MKIGTILAIFMLPGKVPVKNDWLKICARGTATSCTVVLITFIDMLSNPSLVLDFRFFSHIYDFMFIRGIHEDVSLAVISEVI